MASITPKQLLILEWIEQYLAQNHTMPSRREIALGIGVSSPATIQQHIEALEEKGFLKRGEARESRALQWTSRSKKFLAAIHTSTQIGSKSAVESSNIPGKAPPPLWKDSASAILPQAPVWEVPMLGTIAAGYPIEVYPEAKTVALPLDLFVSSKAASSPDQFYVLTVRGDSMIDEGIFPNDWVLLRKTAQAKTGDTVAALINGEATLKKFVKTKGEFELHPANPKYPVIPISKNDRFEIQGILVGLVRKFT